MVLGASASLAQTWNVDANGSWGTASNWTPNSVPNAVGASATLGGKITANRTVNLNLNVTVGSLTIDDGNSYTVTSRTLTFQAASGNAALSVNQSNGNGAHTISSAAALNSNLTLTQNSTGSLTMSGVVSGAGSITKEGAGNVILSGANTYTGTTTINNGSVTARSATAFGGTAAGTSVGGGGSLILENGITVTGETLSLAGSGVSGNGALLSNSGVNRWDSGITLANNATISSASGSVLYLGSSSFNRTIDLGAYTLTFSGSGSITNNSAITGTGGVVKTGTGTVHYYTTQLNTYTGDTVIQQGSLILDNLDKSNASIRGNVTIGDNVSAPGSATLALGYSPYANDLINDNSTFTINQSGQFRLNGQYEVIGPLVMQGGSINSALYQGSSGSTAMLYLNGDVTGLANANYTSTITANIGLNGANRTFAVADGAPAVDMSINGVVSGAINGNTTTGGGLIKTGAGTLELTGSAANTYTGPTVISGGTLRLNKSSGDAIASGGSIQVNSGGTLLLAGANQIGNTANLTLNGGTFNTGGNSETLGTLTLTANSTIDFGGSANTLTFASSSASAWTAATALTLQNWTSSSDHLFFGNSAAGLSAAQVASIRFSNPGGFTAGLYGARILASGEVVPLVPEPATLAAAGLLLAGIIRREAKRITQWLARCRAAFSAAMAGGK